MTRTLLLLTVGSLFLMQDPAGTTQRQESIVSRVRTGPVDEANKRLVHELRELRNQLVTVYGESDPIVKKVDRQIVVNSAKNALIVDRLLDVPFVQLEFGSEPGADPGIANGTESFDSRRVWFNELPQVVAGVPAVPPVPGVSQWGPFGDQGFVPASGIIRATGGSVFDKKMDDLRRRWLQATEAPQKEAIGQELRSTFEQQFDADLEQRRQQFAELEKKLAELRQQIEKREAMRDEFVQVHSRHTELTWDGISLPNGKRTTTVIAKPAAPESVPAADTTRRDE